MKNLQEIIMSNLKNEIINKIIEVEGGYVNDFNDSGGETKYGITKNTAQKYGYTGLMVDMPKDIAYQIYENEFWDKLNLSLVEVLSTKIAEELADTGANTGIIQASKFLQRSLNVLNNKQKYYNDLTVDGEIGSMTVNALRQYLSVRGKEGEEVLYKMLNSLQGAFYIELAEHREKDEKFIYGWFRNRIA